MTVEYRKNPPVRHIAYTGIARRMENLLNTVPTTSALTIVMSVAMVFMTCT